MFGWLFRTKHAKQEAEREIAEAKQNSRQQRLLLREAMQELAEARRQDAEAYRRAHKAE